MEIPFVAAVLLSLVSSGVHSQEIIFRADSFPLPYYYQEGGEVKVSCWHNSSLQFQYWIHPTKGNISESQGRATLDKEYSVDSLLLSNAGQADNGNYFCVCSFGALSLTSNAISANIRLPIIVHVDNTNITIGVGESHTFSCNASNIVQIQWSHFSSPNVDTVLGNTSDGRIEITRNHDLQLRHIQLNDSGIYQCLLINNIMLVEVRHILNVVGNTSTTFFRMTSSKGSGNNNLPYYFYIVIGIAVLCLLIISIIALCVKVNKSITKYRSLSGMLIHEKRFSPTEWQDLSNSQQLLPTCVSPNNMGSSSDQISSINSLTVSSSSIISQ